MSFPRCPWRLAPALGGPLIAVLLVVGSPGLARTEPVVEASIIDPRVIPERLEIARGTTVVWTNNGTVNHTVTSDRGLWDSGPIRRRGQFGWTFDQSGEFRYHCELHPSIKGVVAVGGGPTTRPAPPPAAVAEPAPVEPAGEVPRQGRPPPEPTVPPSSAAAPEPSLAPAEPTTTASRLEPPAPPPSSLPAAPPVAPAISSEPMAPLPRSMPLPALRFAVQRLVGDALLLLRLTPATEGTPSISWQVAGATIEVAASATPTARALYVHAGPPPPIPPPSGTILVGQHVYRFASADGSSLTFDTPVSISLEYREGDLAGASEETLTLAVWDLNPGTWQILPTSLDRERRRVTASVDRLTAVALVAGARDR